MNKIHTFRAGMQSRLPALGSGKQSTYNIWLGFVTLMCALFCIATFLSLFHCRSLVMLESFPFHVFILCSHARIEAWHVGYEIGPTTSLWPQLDFWRVIVIFM